MQNAMLQTETIRLSDLTGKNVVNIYDGVRLGAIYEPVVAFDEVTGQLEQLYLGGRNGITGNWSEKNSIAIPWHNVHKIGQEVVIVDMGHSVRSKNKLF